MTCPPGARQFATTHWSLVAAAGSDAASASRVRTALETLCKAYWYPLYTFVRLRGYSADDAQDLTQDFFEKMIETSGFATVDPRRGRFRSYLLGALKHFLANNRQREKTEKRGGRVRFIAWDAVNPEARYAGASTSLDDPDYAFDRAWAIDTVGSALEALRTEMVRLGKSEQFDVLKDSLTGEQGLPRQQMAARLGTTEEAVKVAIHRLRKRFRKLLRAAVAETVSNKADLDDEMRHLAAILRRL